VRRAVAALEEVAGAGRRTRPAARQASESRDGRSAPTAVDHPYQLSKHHPQQESKKASERMNK